jgi:type IV pilus assembly protein PilB
MVVGPTILPMILSDDQVKALILKTGLANEQALQELVEFSKNSNVSLADALIEKDIISDENLGILIADSLKIPFTVLSKLSIPEDVFHIVPEKIARKHKVIPFEKTHEGLKVATTDPRRVEILSAISKKTGLKVMPFLATERDVENILRIYKRDLQRSFEKLLQKELGCCSYRKNCKSSC